MTKKRKKEKKSKTKRTINKDRLSLNSPSKRFKPNSLRNPAYAAVFGEDAQPELSLLENQNRRRNFIYIKDVQDLILWVLTNTANSKVFFVKHKALIEKILVIHINSLDHYTLTSNLNTLNVFERTQEKMNWIQLQMHAPWGKFNQNSSLMSDSRNNAQYWKFRSISNLFKVKVDKPKQPRKHTLSYETLGSTLEILKKESHADTKNSSKPENSTIVTTTVVEENYAVTRNNELTEKISRDQLLLTDEQLIEHGFPNETYVEQQFVRTISTEQTATNKDRMIAVDCEMCITTKGMELTRATLVDEYGNVLYDEYVKPDNAIVDYNTRYSGITSSHLEKVTKRLADVQKDILNIIDANTILVGHSLENDLHSMRIIHKRIIDTSVLYPHPKGDRYKLPLRTLSQKFLGRSIQTNSDGHDSVEDAVAALDLIKMKLIKGIDFGKAHQRAELESILAVMNREKKKSVIIDTPLHLNRINDPATSAISAMSDIEAVFKLKKQLEKEENFIWCHLHGLENLYNHKRNEQITEEEISSSLQSINSDLESIVELIPEDTLCIILSGHGNLDRIQKLTDQVKEEQQPDQTNSSVYRDLMQTIAQASMGFAYFGIKQRNADDTTGQQQ